GAVGAGGSWEDSPHGGSGARCSGGEIAPCPTSMATSLSRVGQRRRRARKAPQSGRGGSVRCPLAHESTHRLDDRGAADAVALEQYWPRALTSTIATS